MFIRTPTRFLCRGSPFRAPATTATATATATTSISNPPSFSHIAPRCALTTDYDIKHHDLASFKAYATAVNLDPASTIYRGTIYEFGFSSPLQPYSFSRFLTQKLTPSPLYITF